MYVSLDELMDLGVSRQQIEAKLECGEWKAYQPKGTGQKRVLISSLPAELQLKLASAGRPASGVEQIVTLLREAAPSIDLTREDELMNTLSRLSAAERVAWLKETVRLSRIVERYMEIAPKRRRNPATRRTEFVAEVKELCQQAVCQEPLILLRHPHRSHPPSPETLNRWMNAYRREGMIAFLRNLDKSTPPETDRRRAEISPEAAQWVNANWRRFKGARFLYRALEDQAQAEGWSIPAESWFYRLWRGMPEILKTYLGEGRQAYESRHASYVPRDYSDLGALQVLCGDHSERDVTVTLPDGTLARPWLTLWQDLRTGLIWGWHLDVAPSSITAGLAYADGVQNFGAQPPSRQEDGYFSYVYTDHGRDYKSHHWDGRVIAVHERAMTVEGGLEFLCVERRIGILEDLQLRHLLARGRNPREKPIERTFRDFSDWEENTFAEYCGREAKRRPDAWRELYARYQRLAAGAKGEKTSDSPFMTLDHYREALAAFIVRYNTSPHERSTLHSKKIVPLDEFRRLYTTRYEIRPETLALILLKGDRRMVQKNGVQCFQKSWSYAFEEMSEFKDQWIEVRYDDNDYGKVWVVLPGVGPREAQLITPTSFINPDKETLKTVARLRARERQILREYELIQASSARGESVEDRVANASRSLTNTASPAPEPASPASVHLLRRLEQRKLSKVPAPGEITADQVAGIKADFSIFDVAEVGAVSEFDGDDEDAREEAIRA